jgi:diguanylate cyclase
MFRAKSRMAESNAAYQQPDIPADEESRLEELHELGLLDTASDLRFDRYTRLVSEMFEFPIVLVSLVDRDRQWLKSSCGLDVRETSRDVSFCAHAINAHGVMVVPDAREDPRFAGNPLVTGDPHIRFYAGALVHGPGGQPLGTLCVIDRKPRDFDDIQCRRLKQFAELIESEIAHQHDLKTLRSSMRLSAYYDPLTGLANRRLLHDRLGTLIDLAGNEKRPVAVLLFNISGLRLINQSFGSAIGDDLLCQVGERLQSCCPPGGTTARLQADEFVLCFSPPNGSTHEIDQTAEQARQALARAFLSGDREHYIQVQIGGSVFPEHGNSAAAMIERAAAAIRFSESSAGAGIRYFSKKESLDISERLKIESRLQSALAQEQLYLVYQPVVDLNDGRVAAVEALCRWHDPELGEVPPDRFIPIAEQGGLIQVLGRWVQNAACHQIKQWRKEGSWDIPVAINVAADELQRPGFASDLLGRLADENINSSDLWLEVTEHSLVSDSPVLQDNLARLHKASVLISIDDFGTGYSSLSYLGRLPISCLKIDRGFISGLPEGRSELALVQTIISMANAFGIDTVGEGIETRAQLDWLTDHGCRYAQGFLFAKPMAPEQIRKMCQRTLL